MDIQKEARNQEESIKSRYKIINLESLGVLDALKAGKNPTEVQKIIRERLGDVQNQKFCIAPDLGVILTIEHGVEEILAAIREVRKELASWMMRTGAADVLLMDQSDKACYQGQEQDDPWDEILNRKNKVAKIIHGLSNPFLANISQLSHPFLAQEMYLTTDDGRIICLAPDYRNFDNFYKARRRLDKSQKLRIMLRVMEATQYIHDEGLVHGDIKGSNIIIDGTNQGEPNGILTDTEGAVIAGYITGFAKTTAYVEESYYNRKGPDENDYEPLPKTPGADVFALGMTLLEVFVNPGFAFYKTLTEIQKILATVPKEERQKRFFELLEEKVLFYVSDFEVDEEMIELLEGMLCEREKRMSLDSARAKINKILNSENVSGRDEAA